MLRSLIVLAMLTMPVCPALDYKGGNGIVGVLISTGQYLEVNTGQGWRPLELIPGLWIHGAVDSVDNKHLIWIVPDAVGDYALFRTEGTIETLGLQ